MPYVRTSQILNLSECTHGAACDLSKTFPTRTWPPVNLAEPRAHLVRNYSFHLATHGRPN
jgi:hypothetical protein